MISHYPLVSVIIPNYNHYHFLETRIQSVLNQTYQNTEVIILDDFSTDASIEIIEKYTSNPKVKHIVYNQENSGTTFKQWSKGIALACGEWVWLAESDDSAELHFLEKLIELIRPQNNIGIAYCQSLSMDATNKIWGDCLEWTDDLDVNLWRSNFIIKGQEAIEKYLVVKNIIPNASACIIRKSALDEIGNLPLTMKYCGDWFLWCQILLKYDLAYLSAPLNFYRFHIATTRSFSTNEQFLRKLEEDCQVIQFITSHVSIDPQLIHASIIKLENDVYVYYKDSRKFPYSLNQEKLIFSKYSLPVSISLFKLCIFNLNVLWKKLK